MVLLNNLAHKVTNRVFKSPQILWTIKKRGFVQESSSEVVVKHLQDDQNGIVVSESGAFCCFGFLLNRSLRLWH